MDLKNYFTTGEFSKILGVSKDTLFYYDKIGIFSPQLKLDNKYRYYSIFQIEPFYVIYVLKELGMPLNEIKDYMSEKNPSKLINILNKLDLDIDKQILKLKEMKSFIEKKKSLTESAKFIKHQSIDIIDLEEEYLFISLVKDNGDENLVFKALAEHIQDYIGSRGFMPPSIGQINYSNSTSHGPYGFLAYFYTKILDPKPDEKIYKKVKGSYLTSYHLTGYSNINESYENMINFAVVNNIKTEGYFFEDIVIDELATSGYDNFAVEISIKVLEK